MYGVPENIPLQKFIGDYLSLVGFDLASTYFTFGKCGLVHAEGSWELRDSLGVVSAYSDRNTERQFSGLESVLNENISGFSVSAPDSFTFEFSNGFSLTIHDDSDHYESIHIEIEDIII